MEKITKPHCEHQILLKDRATMSLSGVLEVISFTDTEISLKTTCGGLLLRGTSLNIGHLNTDTGELAVSGCITLIKYNKSNTDGGFFEGLFK